MLLIGDAAGLAYPESGEGIRPAIESGQLAARTLIASNGRVDIDALQPYAETLRRLHPQTTRRPAPVRAALATVGRALLTSPAFTRHVVLGRWFLRSSGALRGVE
jgi:flavin-dependent dehydrogenase